MKDSIHGNRLLDCGVVMSWNEGEAGRPPEEKKKDGG
jgi:hypothetical protein